ncbi:Protein VAC14 [Dirofilaria immitis]
MEAPVCYNCDYGCNDTSILGDENMNNFDLNPLNRSRRRSTIVQRSCYKFQLELVLIPLSIAMIPFGLFALLFCVCFCGPKESRGKVPEVFKKKTKINAKDANEIDSDELTCKNGIIMRKDSKKIRFSTAISFIETNYVNNGNSKNDQISKDDQSIIPAKLSPADNDECTIENNNTIVMNINNPVEQIPIDEKKLESQKGNDESESDRLPSRINSKRTRFSDEIDILDELKS